MASTAKKTAGRRAVPVRAYDVARQHAHGNKAANSVTAPAKIESPMASALAQLNGDVYDLSLTVQTLLSRLEVVSTPTPPSEAETAGESAYHCETVTNVLEQTARVRMLAYALSDATARLEI